MEIISFDNYKKSKDNSNVYKKIHNPNILALARPLIKDLMESKMFLRKDLEILFAECLRILKKGE